MLPPSAGASGADERGRLGVHELLQHRAEHPAHELTGFGAAHHLEQDAHRRSLTIEVMAPDEAVLDGARYATDGPGYAAMLRHAQRWPDRLSSTPARRTNGSTRDMRHCLNHKQQSHFRHPTLGDPRVH